jgi:pyridinium-3,5-bisthiocarboxylic acid mononucleotide nickel chelatase
VELLKGYRVAGSDLTGELTTPTGAAILTTLTSECGPMPSMTTELVGYGAGQREYENHPNLLRVVIGEDATSESADVVWRVETNIDDMNPELMGHVFERLFAEGALDVFAMPVQMKKGRPATQLVVLCTSYQKEALERVMFAETTTFGVREMLCHRRKLTRKLVKVKTELGELVVKVGSFEGRVCTAAPEYERCREIAIERGIPLKEVYARAEEAYRQQFGGKDETEGAS